MLEKFDFNGCAIRMEKRADGFIWVCITDMAKISNKLVADWRRLKTTQDFLITFERSMGFPITETIQGGQPEKQGTWVIQEIAIKFAAWCSVNFEIWMLEKIKTLMNEGTVSLRPKTALELAREQVLLLEDLERKKELIAQQEKDIAMQRLFLQVKEEVIQKQDVILNEQTNKLEEQKPKVEFYEAVRESETNITFNQYAKILSNKLNNKLPSMGDVTLFQILRENGFLMSHSKAKDIWNIPYQRFINQGIFAIIEKSYGKNNLYTQTLITPKGQQYLFKWFTEKYIPKVIDIADYRQPVEEMTLSDHIAEIEKMNQSS